MACDAITATPDSLDRTALVESNHRIANHLAIIASILHSQANSLRADGAAQVTDIIHLLLDSETKIEAVARLHRLLSSIPAGTSTVDLGAYLYEIVDAAMCSLADVEETEFSCDIDTDHAIPAKDAAPLGILIVEAMTNALKYSNPSGKPVKICISCRNSDSNVIIEVADDGAGLPEGFDPTIGGGVGFSLIRRIAEQLGGQLEFDQQLPGLCVRLLLPIAQRPLD
jgi:two-component sensor histidine kinase